MKMLKITTIGTYPWAKNQYYGKKESKKYENRKNHKILANLKQIPLAKPNYSSYNRAANVKVTNIFTIGGNKYCEQEVCVSVFRG